MAAALAIEEEFGSSLGWVHPHKGYFAGDFSATTASSASAVRVAATHVSRADRA